MPINTNEEAIFCDYQNYETASEFSEEIEENNFEKEEEEFELPLISYSKSLNFLPLSNGNRRVTQKK